MREPSGDPSDPTEREPSRSGEETGPLQNPGDETTDLESGPATDPATVELNPDQTREWRVKPGGDPPNRRADHFEESTQNGDESSDPASGTQVRYIGDYELGTILGTGGMGVVFRARQVSLNRQVALKLIRNKGVPSESEARRFQHEAEAVASLDHPSIVPIYEVGVHEGRHYFSMKLIPGQSLQQASPRLRGNYPAIGQIMSGAARGVQHAHERGILHRDLKPANILLDSTDAPHVTDFGLAKRIDTGDAEMTQTDALLGTPAYMAPEQTTATRGAVTISTDVYGLGAILYALLSGRAPHRGSSVLELLDAVREAAPEPPSKTDPTIPRDLEVICMKCLDKDPRRRYRSAEEVADDLDRWRDGRPITARHVGAAARAVMWCRRRPLIAGLAAALVIAVAVGTTGIVVNWLEVRRANVRIRAEYETSQSLNEFLVNDMIGQSSPFSVGIRDVPVSALLDRSSGLAASRFSNRPKTEASVRQALGLAYLALGMIPKAETEFLQSSRLRQSLPADDELDRLSSEFLLGRVRLEQGRFDEAEAHLLKAYQGQKERLGERDLSTIQSAEALAADWRAKGRLDDARKLLEANVAFAREGLGDQHPQTLRSRTDLAIIDHDLGRYRAALPVFEEVAALNLASHGRDHPETLLVRSFLGQTLVSLGEDARAEEVVAEILDPARAILGPDHPATLRISGILAAARTNQKKFAEASQTLDPASKGSPNAAPVDDAAHYVVEINRLMNLLEQSKLVEAERGSRDLISRMRTHLPADDPMLGISLSILAVALWEQNRTGEAEPINAEAIAILLKRLPVDHPQVVNTESNQAAILLANGKAIEAERLATRMIEIRSRPGWVGNPSRLGSSKSVLGGALAGQKRFGEAEPLLLEGFRIIEADPKAKKKSRDDAVERLIQFYQSQGKAEEAARWRARRAPQPGP